MEVCLPESSAGDIVCHQGVQGALLLCTSCLEVSCRYQEEKKHQKTEREKQQNSFVKDGRRKKERSDLSFTRGYCDGTGYGPFLSKYLEL